MQLLCNNWQWTNVIRLPEIKTAELSTYGNFAKCHQAHFRVSHAGLGTRLVLQSAHFDAMQFSVAVYAVAIQFPFPLSGLW